MKMPLCQKVNACVSLHASFETTLAYVLTVYRKRKGQQNRERERENDEERDRETHADAIC